MAWVRAQTEAQADAIEAWAWVLYYDEALDDLARLAAAPHTNGIGAMVTPAFGDPVDWDTRTRRLVWITQRCPTVVVFPLDPNSGRSLVYVHDWGLGLADVGNVTQWIASDLTAPVPRASDLALLRTMPDRAEGTRPRRWLGLDGVGAPNVVRPLVAADLETDAEVLGRSDAFAQALANRSALKPRRATP